MIWKLVRKIEKLVIQRSLFFWVLFSFILRFAAALLLGQVQSGYENAAIARNIIEGNGFAFSAFPPATSTQQTCFMAPFYPYFLAVFYLLFGESTFAVYVIQIVQATVGSLTILPVAHLAQSHSSKKASSWSCLLFAAYPDFIYSAVVLHQLVFTTFGLTLTVMLLSAIQEKGLKSCVAGGVAAGWTLLVNPAMIAPIGLTMLLIIYRGIKNKVELLHGTSNMRGDALKKSLVLVAVAILVISPWQFRCMVVQDGRLLFLKDGGFNLWRGNNPEYTETGIPIWYPPELVLGFNTTSEAQIDTRFLDLALQYISTNWWVTLQNMGRKFLDFWWFPSALPEQTPLIRKISYAPLLALFVAGLLLEAKNSTVSILLLLPILGLALVYSVTFVLPRYRVPIQPLMLIWASYSVECATDKITSNLGGSTKT